jgi:protein phosphatase
MLRGTRRELILAVHHRSDAGCLRDHNEDYLGYRQPEEPEVRAEAGWLYAVADGVGGAQEGEVASKLAVRTLLAAYYESYRETPADRLREAFVEANRVVYEQASEQPGPHRMSTTLVAAAILGQQLTLANVGDSRAYLIREREIRQITRDHSVVARLVIEGVITPEQAESHPRRHVISRSIGAAPEVRVDLFEEAFLPGDRLLLCSDGLTEHVTDDEIVAAMQGEDPEASVQQLVDVAKERGSTDNITVLLVRALRGREDRLPPLASPPETEAAPVSRRSSWLWIGIVVAILAVCVAALAAGTSLWLNRTPTPAATPLPALATPTATATAFPTPTLTTVASPSAEGVPSTVEVPSTGTVALPTATSLAPTAEIVTPRPTAMPPPSATPTATPSMVPTATASPTPAETPSPGVTEPASPTATSTSESSLLPTPTSTTEGSPLATPP